MIPGTVAAVLVRWVVVEKAGLVCCTNGVA